MKLIYEQDLKQPTGDEGSGRLPSSIITLKTGSYSQKKNHQSTARRQQKIISIYLVES
jgi:hypothetical protein